MKRTLVLSMVVFVLITGFTQASTIAESYESNLVCLQNVSFAGIGTFASGANYALVGGSAIVRIAADGLGLGGLLLRRKK
jgi:hypothetical protein